MNEAVRMFGMTMAATATALALVLYFEWRATWMRRALADGEEHDRDVDETLEASFPASDPPSWSRATAHPGVIDVSARAPSEPTFGRALAATTAAAAILLLVPFAILLIGTPIALAVRAAVAILSRLFALVS